MAKSEVGSNIAQNDSKWALIVILSDILYHFSQQIDQKCSTKETRSAAAALSARVGENRIKK